MRSVTVLLLFLAGSIAIGLCTVAAAQDKANPDPKPTITQNAPTDVEKQATEQEVANKQSVSPQTLILSLTIFVLAIFVGFEVITKVPPTLHTPLMSGANAISGITIVGAVIVAGTAGSFPSFVAMIAVALAMVNAVGGFYVTHRMLSMFKRK